MAIIFHIPGPLRVFTSGQSQVEVKSSPATLGEALSLLWTMYPGIRDRIATEQGHIREHIGIFVGNESIRYTGGLATPLRAASEITILPAVSGGAEKLGAPLDKASMSEKKRFVYALKLLERVKWAEVKGLLIGSFDQWNKQNATRLAGSLAFYSLLSLAPLLLVLISIVGMVLGHSAAQREVVDQVTALVGPAAGNAMAAFVKGSKSTSGGVLATVFGLVTLLFSASGVVIELRSALNVIWEVPDPNASGFAMVKSFIKQRLFSFAMVLGVGFLLIVSLFISTWITAFAALSASIFPGEAVVFHIANIVFSFLVISILFAAVYKVMPDVRLEWRDVLLGGVVTSVLFTLGKFLLGLYLGRASYASMYGAAASIVVLIAWVYYSAQIFFLGAEFTREFARRKGSKKGMQPKQATQPANAAKANS